MRHHDLVPTYRCLPNQKKYPATGLGNHTGKWYLKEEQEASYNQIAQRKSF